MNTHKKSSNVWNMFVLFLIALIGFTSFMYLANWFPWCWVPAGVCAFLNLYAMYQAFRG